MDITRLTHTLTIGSTATQIDEPVGFDSLKVTLKRGDYHGISAEMSVGTLEFYGKAAEIIRTAYNTDINTEIVYVVTDETGAVFYTGQIDLSTYQSREDVYHSVSCKVGEIGVKTTFNNRTDVAIDLNTNKTVGGLTMAHSPQWNKITLPEKRISLSLKVKTGDTNVVRNSESVPGGDFQLQGQPYVFISVPFTLNEPYIKEFAESPQIPQIAYYDPEDTDPRLKDYYNPLIQIEDNFIEKYGTDIVRLNLDMTIKVKALDDFWTHGQSTATAYFRTVLILGDLNTGFDTEWTPRNIIAQTEVVRMNNDNKEATFHLTANLNLMPQTQYYFSNKYFLGINMVLENTLATESLRFTPMEVTVMSGSHFEIYVDTNKGGDVALDVMLVHNVFNRIAEAVSDNALTCRSTLMTYPMAAVNPGNWGGMSPLALTNGYKIRGIFSEGADERGIQMSFKEAVQALEALTPIGWGLTEENGQIYLRVEPWDWFYKSDVVLTIEGANDKQRSVDTDRIITELTIGYKKYTTNEEYNATDNIHTERTYNSNVTAISKSKSLLCAWIADTYAIEETRRKALESKTTEEFKYDENIFSIELAFIDATQEWFVPQGMRNATHINNPDSYYNTRLSPRRNAERWKKYMALFNSQRDIRFLSGKVNTIAAFNVPRPYSTTTHYIDSPNAVLTENDNIEWTQPDMKAEKIKIKYPLTLTQYRAIAANPYGLIVVDGEACWLKEMQYELATGEADLTLIPKIVQPNNNNSND